MNLSATASPASNVVSFDAWLLNIGKTRCTGFRWRKAGMIQTFNIHGRQYLTREEIAKFEQRALSGEFAKKATTPKRTTEEAAR